MTKVTQVTAGAFLAVFVSTAFVTVADAKPQKVWCKQTSSKIFRTACEELKRRQLSYVKVKLRPGVRKVQNFRGRSGSEFVQRSLNGGSNGSGGRGGRGGKP